MPSPTYHPRTGPIETDLDHELVLLDPGTQEMYSLNETGRLLWRALPASEDELARILAEHYDLPDDDAVRDARAWLEELSDAGLVVRVENECG